MCSRLSRKIAHGKIMRLHSSSTPSPPKRKMTAMELQRLKRNNCKIAMVTAYDYPSAMHADRADFDIILVGDSLGERMF